MQNVLFADGHVKWHPTPRTGIDQDNIYTYWSGESESGCLHKAIGRWDTFTKQFKSTAGAQDITESYLGN